MRQLVPLVTSLVTLWGIYEAGNKRSRGWLIGLANQGLWLVFIISFEAWGLLPLTVALTGMYSRNLLRWRAEERELVRGC